PNPVTIVSLVDNVYGDLTTQGTCTTAVGTVLVSGGSYTCAFPGVFTGLAPATQTDTATVNVIDNQGLTATASAVATVALTPVPPSIAVVKLASPPSLPAPGGTFTFVVIVTNNSVKPVTVINIVDNVYGDINGRGTCVIGTVLAAGGTYSCSFPGVFNGVGGQTQTDTVTVTAVDSTGTQASATDNAIAAITTVASPSITVQKSVTPSNLPNPGGTFTFTATVNNTSTEVLTLTSLVDNVYGDLNGQSTCSVPQTLPVGGSYTCAFPGDFTAPAFASQTDTITATAVDTGGIPASAIGQVTVFVTSPPPVAVLLAIPTNGPAPLAVSFDGSPSTAGTGATLSSWTLDFGAGEGPPISGTGDPQAPTGSHTYVTTGPHTATLTVTQAISPLICLGRPPCLAEAQTDSAQVVITVTLPPPVAVLGANPTSGTAPLAVSFDGSPSTAGAGATLSSWTLDFGAGEGPPISGTGAPPPLTGSHTYVTTGPHTATLTVTQSDGQSDSAQA
ncbi:MAG: PKD domain-containing protein, partial [Actinobacteria bacterium]|nr:PKD domain-containing protein [Actinomycetota bacterium]